MIYYDTKRYVAVGLAAVPLRRGAHKFTRDIVLAQDFWIFSSQKTNALAGTTVEIEALFDFAVAASSG